MEHNVDHTILDVNLRKLEKIINASTWLRNNQLEPCIGDRDCPAEAESYGTRGQSVYTAFIENYDGDTYGCRYTPCRGYSAQCMEEAVRHLRHHHFNHSPYLCTPASGNTWYVLVFHIIAGWGLTDAPLLAAAVSPLNLTSRITSKNAHSRLPRESMLSFTWLGSITFLNPYDDVYCEHDF